MLDARANRVTDLAVHLELLLLGAGRLARVRKTPVQALLGAEENGAGFVGLITHGDHGIEWLVEIAIKRFARLVRDVDAKFGHGADRQRTDVGRLGSGRERLVAIAAKAAQEPFGHLAARGVVRAQEQHAPFRGPRVHGLSHVGHAEHTRNYSAERTAYAGQVDIDEKTHGFLHTNHSAAMVTLRTDGSAHVVRVGVALVDGKLWSTAREAWVRTRHVRRDPRATLFVFESPGFGYLSIESRVRILDGPDVPDATMRLMHTMQGRQASEPVLWYGRELSADEFRQAMLDERRILFEFEPLRIYP